MSNADAVVAAVEAPVRHGSHFHSDPDTHYPAVDDLNPSCCGDLDYYTPHHDYDYNHPFSPLHLHYHHPSRHPYNYVNYSSHHYYCSIFPPEYHYCHCHCHPSRLVHDWVVVLVPPPAPPSRMHDSYVPRHTNPSMPTLVDPCRPIGYPFRSFWELVHFVCGGDPRGIFYGSCCW